MNRKEILARYAKDKNLAGVNLRRANLYGANLSRADLTGANLSGAYLSRADLTGANLSGADLKGADLTEANLAGAILSRADLTGAYLYGVNLTEANLSGADIEGADFTGADIEGAVFTPKNENPRTKKEATIQPSETKGERFYAFLSAQHEDISAELWGLERGPQAPVRGGLNGWVREDVGCLTWDGWGHSSGFVTPSDSR